MNDGPVTRGRRFFKLAGMTAQVAGSYAKTRIKSIFQSEEAAEHDRHEAHELNGGRIARTLGELKGAVMKVGQMASIAGDILPKEMADALRSLQREAPPVDYEVIAGQIERELGSTGCPSRPPRSARSTAPPPMTGARSWSRSSTPGSTPR